MNIPARMTKSINKRKPGAGSVSSEVRASRA
jgi:hypothetical protein